MVRLTFLYWGTGQPLPNPLSWLTSWNPEAKPEEQETNPSPIPQNPLPSYFSFKSLILAFPRGCSWSRLSLPVSPESNKGIWIRSSGFPRLSLSHTFLTGGMDAKKNCSCHCVRHTHHTGQYFRRVKLLQGDQRQTSCFVTLLLFLARRSLEHMVMPASRSSLCKLQIHI